MWHDELWARCALLPPAGAHRAYSYFHPGTPHCDGHFHNAANIGYYTGVGFWRTLFNWQSAPREGDEHSIVDEVECSAPISGPVDGLPMMGAANSTSSTIE